MAVRIRTRFLVLLVAGVVLAQLCVATTAPPVAADTQGPGGPVLVITDPSNPFTRYYSEILSAEGLNEYSLKDLSQVNASTLGSYDVVVLGEMALTDPQVTMLTNWVTGGGNLIAMRPDHKLAGLLGLADSHATLPNAYLKIDTSSGPGVGIVGEPIQYHGDADLYTLAGATAVASLYTNRSTATSAPAVTMRSVGANGGQAAAFTYDLARSGVLTRQGNPAWVGQQRDGVDGYEASELFVGVGGQPDWNDLDHATIPIADEQQRLFANMIEQTNLDKKPLPRFWYYPRGLKAVVVMTGDDHAHGGTAARFDQYKAASPAGCNVANWECIRSSSYMYTATPLSNADASTYMNQGFEVGLHLVTGCGPWGTPTDLDNDYQWQLDTFKAKYTSLPPLRRSRRHPDRRLPGHGPADRRDGAARAGDGQHAARQRARRTGLLRRADRQHAHRLRGLRRLRRDHRVGQGAGCSCRVGPADAHLARRPERFVVPEHELERQRPHVHRRRRSEPAQRHGARELGQRHAERHHLRWQCRSVHDRHDQGHPVRVLHGHAPQLHGALREPAGSGVVGVAEPCGVRVCDGEHVGVSCGDDLEHGQCAVDDQFDDGAGGAVRGVGSAGERCGDRCGRQCDGERHVHADHGDGVVGQSGDREQRRRRDREPDRYRRRRRHEAGLRRDRLASR